MAHSVLLVDDDRQLRLIYRMLLERAGYQVHEAADGAEALRFLGAAVPDVLLMDMMMPLLDGAAVLQRIRENPTLASLKIVILTANPRCRETAEQFHADHFLVKPIKPDDLMDALQAVLAPAVQPDRVEQPPD